MCFCSNGSCCERTDEIDNGKTYVSSDNEIVVIGELIIVRRNETNETISAATERIFAFTGQSAKWWKLTTIDRLKINSVATQLNVIPTKLFEF